MGCCCLGDEDISYVPRGDDQRRNQAAGGGAAGGAREGRVRDWRRGGACVWPADRRAPPETQRRPQDGENEREGNSFIEKGDCVSSQVSSKATRWVTCSCMRYFRMRYFLYVILILSPSWFQHDLKAERTNYERYFLLLVDRICRTNEGNRYTRTRNQPFNLLYVCFFTRGRQSTQRTNWRLWKPEMSICWLWRPPTPRCSNTISTTCPIS